MQAEKVAQERQLLTKIHCLPVSSIPVYGLLGLHGARNTKLIIFQLLSTLFKIHPQKKKKLILIYATQLAYASCL